MVESNLSLDVHVTSTTQVFPDTTSQPTTTVALSIIDSTVSYFSRAAAIWFYDPPSSAESDISPSLLHAALSKTLNAYRPWCGRLSYAAPQVNGDHTKRYRRVQVTFNAETDLGVTFVTAECANKLSDFLPSPEARRTTSKAWDGSQLPSTGLLPSVKMALSQRNPQPKDANMVIQITKFSCGSTSVGIAIAHGLSDAQGMCTFAKDWASISRAIYAGTDLPVLSPTFNPRLLDTAARGNIDAESPDQTLVKQARNLPLHRFDWYKQVPNQPWETPIPPDFDRAAELSSSDPIPWADWDPNAPVSHRVLHFTPAEVQHIHNLARPSSDSTISKHDALLAHIWKRITIARQLPPSTRIYMNVTMGLRPRLSLPRNFLGSPIMTAAIPIITPATGSKYPPVSEIASLIRSHLELFTPDSIGAHLHDAAFEVSPQRLWQTFLGRKHILQTTWVGAGANNIDFIGSKAPGNEPPKLRYVQPEMGGDGLVLVVESIGEQKAGHWSQNGADVIIYLSRDVMKRLDNDPELWGEKAR